MQATGMDVVLAVAELGAGVERAEDDLERRLLVLGVNADGDAAAIVDDGDRVAGLVERDLDLVGETIEILVDGVVDDLPAEVVQPLLIGGADVHAGANADGLEPLEDADGGFVVLLAGFGGGGH